MPGTTARRWTERLVTVAASSGIAIVAMAYMNGADRPTSVHAVPPGVDGGRSSDQFEAARRSPTESRIADAPLDGGNMEATNPPSGESPRRMFASFEDLRNHVAATLRTETRNPAWAYRAESHLSSAAGELPAGVRMSVVECARTTCRVMLEVETEAMPESTAALHQWQLLHAGGCESAFFPHAQSGVEMFFMCSGGATPAAMN